MTRIGDQVAAHRVYVESKLEELQSRFAYCEAQVHGQRVYVESLFEDLQSRLVCCGAQVVGASVKEPAALLSEEASAAPPAVSSQHGTAKGSDEGSGSEPE